MKSLRELGTCVLARVNMLRKEMITRLNMIGTLLALYALSNQDVSDKLLGFVPEAQRPIAALVFPIFWFWLIQKGKEVDKARTVEKTIAVTSDISPVVGAMTAAEIAK